jgi:hypothetical protein
MFALPSGVGLVRPAMIGLMVLAAGRVSAEVQPVQVTTDTPAYCLQLLDRVSEMVRNASAPPPDEVTDLAAEGQKMCALGEVRGGIMRLRRAVTLLVGQSPQKH